MSGITRLLLVPFVAVSLLLIGCGVPIAPEAITATAVAQEEAARAASLFGGTASTDTALSLRAGSTGLSGAPVQAA